MINLTFLLANLSPILSLIYVVSDDVISLVAILLFLVVVMGGYLYFRKYRRNFVLERKKLNEELRLSQIHNQQLMKEVAVVQSKMASLEKERNNWNEEKERLFQKIKELEEQLAALKMDKNPENKDIIIEYYMNQKLNV